MSDDGKDQIDLLCEDCGETFSDFLHQMADQNAKVATCPKCGKIHAPNAEKGASNDPDVRSDRKK
jgi:uncharacterized Zn finger protein